MTSSTVRRLRVAVAVVLGALLWEGYKAVGNEDGTILFGVRLLPPGPLVAGLHVYDRPIRCVLDLHDGQALQAQQPGGIVNHARGSLLL